MEVLFLYHGRRVNKKEMLLLSGAAFPALLPAVSKLRLSAEDKDILINAFGGENQHFFRIPDRIFPVSDYDALYDDEETELEMPTEDDVSGRSQWLLYL